MSSAWRSASPASSRCSESNGGQLTPTGYDGAIGPALLVGAGSVLIAVVAAFFAPGRKARVTS